MISFQCNICSTNCHVSSLDLLDREVRSCSNCGSTSRFRWVVSALSEKLFGASIPLACFPDRKQIHGLGMTDWRLYAESFGRRFDYTNTFLDEEPRFDITAPIPSKLRSKFDFVICSEVFEHIVHPVQRAFDNLAALLKPAGFILFSVPWIPGKTTEHFPLLHEWTIARCGNEFLVVNRRVDGKIDVHEAPVFHGGPGTTLEMRVFGREDLDRHFKSAGFQSVVFAHHGKLLSNGVFFGAPWSLPCIATL